MECMRGYGNPAVLHQSLIGNQVVSNPEEVAVNQPLTIWKHQPGFHPSFVLRCFWHSNDNHAQQPPTHFERVAVVLL